MIKSWQIVVHTYLDVISKLTEFALYIDEGLETADKSLITFQVYQETIPPPIHISGRISVMSSKEF